MRFIDSFWSLCKRILGWAAEPAVEPVKEAHPSAEETPPEPVPAEALSEDDCETSGITPRKAVSELATGTPFDALNLREEILKGLRDAGFERCTPIQDKTLPLTLSGRDVAAQAQTGSGKTAVFVLTILQRLLSQPGLEGHKSRALIVAPTRELALQIHEDARLLGRYCPFTTAVIYGGVGYEKQIEKLRQGADMVVATPGRLIDLMKQGIFKPDDVSFLVIDEADRMFDMGFVKDLRYIMRRLPPYNRRQSMLFSATLSPRVLELTYEFMNAPEEVVINPEELVVGTVEQTLYHVGRAEKFSLLLGLLKREAAERVLIFTNTKIQAARLADRLHACGYEATAITGDLPQKNRVKILGKFKDGSVTILVATDVASRGIHVEDISHVINYDVPQDPEEYIHRIGRTARAGKRGRAITLASEDDVYHLEAVEKLLGEKIPVVWPEEDWFVKEPPRKRERAPRPGKPKPRQGKSPKGTATGEAARGKTPPGAGAKGEPKRRRRPKRSSKPGEPRRDERRKSQETVE